MKTSFTPTYWIRIYIAGNVADAERICRDYCARVGYCVTVTPTRYVYRFGAEDGVVVGLINYPRFPASPVDIQGHAEALAHALMEGLHQGSYTIETPENTVWYSRRGEDA